MSSHSARVLFLCTGNSCRSQMAEGWARALHGEVLRADSAGTNPQPVNPLAVKVMAEVGIDISHHKSKHLDALSGVVFDLTVTVCDHAAQNCPLPPRGSRVVHHPFDDPPRLAKEATSAEEAVQHYRRVRDEIRDFVLELPALLNPEGADGEPRT